MRPGTDWVNRESDAHDKIRLYARPAARGKAVTGTTSRRPIFRVALGNHAKTGALAWAHTYDADFLGGAGYRQRGGDEAPHQAGFSAREELIMRCSQDLVATWARSRFEIAPFCIHDYSMNAGTDGAGARARPSSLIPWRTDSNSLEPRWTLMATALLVCPRPLTHRGLVELRGASGDPLSIRSSSRRRGRSW